MALRCAIGAAAPSAIDAVAATNPVILLSARVFRLLLHPLWAGRKHPVNPPSVGSLKQPKLAALCGRLEPAGIERQFAIGGVYAEPLASQVEARAEKVGTGARGLHPGVEPRIVILAAPR